MLKLWKASTQDFPLKPEDGMYSWTQGSLPPLSCVAHYTYMPYMVIEPGTSQVPGLYQRLRELLPSFPSTHKYSYILIKLAAYISFPFLFKLILVLIANSCRFFGKLFDDGSTAWLSPPPLSPPPFPQFPGVSSVYWNLIFWFRTCVEQSQTFALRIKPEVVVAAEGGGGWKRDRRCFGEGQGM